MIEHASRTDVFSQSRHTNFQKFPNLSWATGGSSGETVSSASSTPINQD